MKSQDIGVLLKLICLRSRRNGTYLKYQNDWKDWDYDNDEGVQLDEFFSIDSVGLSEYSARSIELSLGISKTQVNLSIKRSESVGLIRRERGSNLPIVNNKALYEFIAYAIRYVFPAKVGVITRGIATSFGAPILSSKLMSGGDLVPVWNDPHGHTKGMMVEPLFKTVSIAVKNDPKLYAMLALVDAVRVGLPRERNLALEELKGLFDL